MKLRFLIRNGEKVLQYLAHTKGKIQVWHDVETVDNDKPSEKEYQWFTFEVSYTLPESRDISVLQISAPTEDRARKHILSIYGNASITGVKRL